MPAYRDQPKAGFIAQAASTSGALPASDLDEAHVYPSPYKPGSGGDFDSEYLVFKQLTADAEIKVFNIAGELCASIEKTDSSVDYYEWDATNDAGEDLASGVYIFYITNEAGETAKGKFAIIR
jgi:hypothetical protein